MKLVKKRLQETITGKALVAIAAFSLALYMSAYAADTGEPTGMFCAELEDKMHKRTNCLCLEFIDQENLTMSTYRTGKNVRTKQYQYTISGDQLTIDTKGEAGLDSLQLLIKSQEKIVSSFDISKGTLASTFAKTNDLPASCQ